MARMKKTDAIDWFCEIGKDGGTKFFLPKAL
jgi:hypothetical protein